MKPYFLIFMQLFFLYVQSHSPVYIINHHRQLVTSSALQWVKSRDGDWPVQSVEGGRNGSEPLFVCRASLGGEHLVGQLNRKGCLVVIGQTSQMISSSYEALVNVDNSARLEWSPWKQYSKVPPGGVSVNGDLFVARENFNSSTHLDPLYRTIKSKSQFIGGLSLQDDYGLITLPPDGNKVHLGQILVEIEPIRYELTSFRHGKIRHLHSSDVMLNKTIELKSEWPKDKSREGKIINYTYTESIYFGKGHNLPTGSMVRVIFENGSHIDLNWGLPQDVDASRNLRMNYYDLPPGSSVYVNIMATKIDRKLEYFSTLVSHYKDGVSLRRPIQGVYRQVVMEHLRPIFGHPKFSQEIAESETRSVAVMEKKIRHFHGERSNKPENYLLGSEIEKVLASSNQTKQAATVAIDYQYEVKEIDIDEWRLPRDNYEKDSRLTRVATSSSGTIILMSQTFFLPILLFVCTLEL